MNMPNATAHRAMVPLRAAIAGDVLVPGDHGYDEARRAWNLAVDQRPAAVVLAESSADVARAVRFARAGDAHRPAGHRPRRRADGVARWRPAAADRADAAGGH